MEAAQRIMFDHRVRHLLLVDESGVHVGLVSDLPLLEACRAGDTHLPVAEIADPGRVRVAPSSMATSVLAKMLHTHTDCAVVIDNELRAVGLFTERDAMELARVAIRPWARVSELMTPGNPLHVSPDTPSQRALDRMIAERIHHLLILDEAHRLAGVLSARDLVSRWAPVGELASKQIYLAREHTPISDAVQLMCSHGIGCLPVVDDRDRLAGILTRTDVLKALARQLLEASAPPAYRRDERTFKP